MLEIFTLLLAVATAMLCWVTWYLARNTKTDFERRKIEATLASWREIRNTVKPGGLDKLGSDSTLNTLTAETRITIRELEYFASCVNSGVYDLDIFAQVSGSWFLQQYDRIRPFIEKSRSNPRVYADLKKLHSSVSAARAKGGVSEEDEGV
jgi:hypothetical protein